nr:MULTISPECIES: YdeI/OmpD-associated family protein [Acidobacterium]
MSRGQARCSPRQLRFRSLAEITRQRPLIRAFIEQAIELEKAGAKVKPRPAAPLAVPQELQARLDAGPALQKGFAALTPAARRATSTRSPPPNNPPPAPPASRNSVPASSPARA